MFKTIISALVLLFSHMLPGMISQPQPHQQGGEMVAKEFFRDAKSSDITSINALKRAAMAYWGYDDEFLDKFIEVTGITKDYLDKNITKLLYMGNELLGFYSFKFIEEGRIELNDLYVHPDYIGRGFGNKLWAACCKKARELDKNEFIIWSEPHAEDFYLKKGCAKIGTRPSVVVPNRYPSVLKYKITKEATPLKSKI